MKRLLIAVVSLLLLSSCAYAGNFVRPSKILSCKVPEGREYICYSPKECREYMEGYGGLMRYKFEAQKDGWWKDEKIIVIHMNLFVDYLGQYLIGRIEGEKRDDGKIWQRMWLMVCDMEDNVLHESYAEGFNGYIPQEVKEWTKN